MRHLFIISVLFVLPFVSCSSIKYSDDRADEHNNVQSGEEETTKELKVLFIGSSFGVNTFIQFPALVASSGIKITGLNLYKGSCTLKDILEICQANGDFENSAVYDDYTRKWLPTCRNIKEVLSTRIWDIVVVQRAAPGKNGGCDQWNEQMAEELRCIISYIKQNTIKEPKLFFNAGFSRSVGALGNREKQLESVDKIISTSRQVYDDFGIKIIPSATAIQNARLTSLANVATYNSNHYSIPDMTGEGDHLDTGLGSYVLGCLMFQQICGEMYKMSINDIDYIPTVLDVQNNAGGFVDKCFTQVTNEQSKIVKVVVYSTINNPWIVDMSLIQRFPSL